jgi:hypothetical protein
MAASQENFTELELSRGVDDDGVVQDPYLSFQGCHLSQQLIHHRFQFSCWPEHLWRLLSWQTRHRQTPFGVLRWWSSPTAGHPSLP